LIRRLAILKAVSDIKRRLRTVLSLYRKWRDNKRFQQLEDLIMNFDKEDPKQVSYTTIANVHTQTKKTRPKRQSLDIVHEENSDSDEF
jgi:hypothetical protein